MPTPKEQGGWGWGELSRSGSGWSWRVRIPRGKRVTLQLADGLTEAEATARHRELVRCKEGMKRAGLPAERIRDHLATLAEASEQVAPVVVAVIGEACAGKLELAKAKPEAPTFREVAEQWTSGELARRFPDQVREKRSADIEDYRLAKYINPRIGNTPVDRVTLEDCEAVMAALPSKLRPLTRRHVGQIMRRVLKLAVYPLRLRESNPLPEGFLPQVRQRKALAYLYTDEDRRLLGCTAIHLNWRVLWGFLTREGMREGEALGLTWRDLDLDRGAVRLDRNKTNDPRTWALRPDVARALRIFREHFRATDELNDRVFRDQYDRMITRTSKPASVLRGHLKLIGLDQERPELFENNDVRFPIRVHDLRGTFVTLSLANGATESWISDRTGHRSSQMINKYKRAARTAAELNQGTLDPLDKAVPELANLGRDLGQQTVKTADSSDEDLSCHSCAVLRRGPQ